MHILIFPYHWPSLSLHIST